MTAWPPELRPMLAGSGPLPTADGWIYEVKWDGVRAIVRTDGDGNLDLRSRTGQNLTPAFPELAALGEALRGRRLTLDGELIAFDKDGQQRFQAVQRRLRTTGPAKIRGLAASTPATLMLFDLLWVGDDDLTGLPWHERRARLETLAGEVTGTHWQLPPAHRGDPRTLLAATKEHKLEGIIAKREDSTYTPGKRAKTWTKHKHSRHQAVVIGGYTPGAGARRGAFGAIQVGVHDASGKLRHAGGVGSGFKEVDLKELRAALNDLVVPKTPFDGGGTPPKGTVFVRPELVAEVEFMDWSDDGALRHPVFRGLRSDLDPTLILREPDDGAGPMAGPPETPGEPIESHDEPQASSSTTDTDSTGATAAPPTLRAARNSSKDGRYGTLELGGISLRVTNLDKPMYPDYPEGFTKGDVIAYYARIAPTLIPHLHGRAVTRLRFPHGSGDMSFFEKRAPKGRPDWVETVDVESGTAGVIDFVTLGPPATLLWLANLAALELHPSLHLGAEPEQPTVLVFDLDPGPPATIVECCRVGLLVREVLTSLGLDAWAKTTGSKGLQVYAPLNVPTTYETTKPLAQAIAMLLQEREPLLITSRMAKKLRGGKVFVDWSQNDAHKTTVSVYSLRAREAPTASTPVTWDEVSNCADSGDPLELRFTAPQLLDRVEQHGDLFAPVLTLQQEPPRLT